MARTDLRPGSPADDRTRFEFGVGQRVRFLILSEDDRNGRQGTVTVDVDGAPVRLAGTLRLAPDRAGTLETVAGDLKARVPIVGGRIEKAAEPAIRMAIEVEEREGRAWLSA